MAERYQYLKPQLLAQALVHHKFVFTLRPRKLPSVTTSVQLQLIENRKTVLGAYHADHEKLVMTEEQLAQAPMSPVMVKNTGVPMAPVRVRNTGVPMSLSM
jgi:hypothetical protein